MVFALTLVCPCLSPEDKDGQGVDSILSSQQLRTRSIICSKPSQTNGLLQNADFETAG